MSSASVSVRLVVHPTDTQIASARDVCVRAFKDNVPIRIMTDDGDPKLVRLFWNCVLKTARAGGTLHVVAPQGSDAVLAVGLWFGPGETPFGTEEQRQLGFYEFMDALPDTVRDWWRSKYGEKMDKVGKEISGEGGVAPLWYAYVVATDPDHQGKGYGSLLVREGLKLAQEDNTPAALMTSQEVNARWYETKFGFECISTVQTTGPAPRYIEYGNTFLRWKPVNV